MRAAAALAVVLLAAVAGCGGDEGESSSAGALPDCVAAEAGEAPEGFPDDFPLPEGTVITFGGDSGAGVFISAVAPGDLDSVATFLRTELEQQGYRIGEEDAEPGEMEAEFEGNDRAGQWRLNEIRDCEGAVMLRVILGGES